MASETLPRTSGIGFETAAEDTGLGHILRTVLRPLASLKLTVTLFVLAIFLILAGTLAQVDKDIWKVMEQYFRTPLAWVELQIFFPRSIKVPGGFFFPGGFTIGSLMLANLLSAHAIRFKVQAGGARLLTGLALIGLGAWVTWVVVTSGSNKEGIQDLPLFGWDKLWAGFQFLLGLLAVASGVVATAIDRQRYIERRLLWGLAAALGLTAAALVYAGPAGALSDSSMRILWQLSKGELAGLVLLAGCSLLFGKRAGIVLLHAGVGLMMINELVVYTLHEEGQMHIREGQTVNYVQDIRKLELAIIDRSLPGEDEVVVVPMSRLPKGVVVNDPVLPCRVELVKFLPNTDPPRKLREGEQSLADRGVGLSATVDEVKPASGVDSGGKVDLAAAYVKFLDKNDPAKPQGTYLVSLWQSQADDLPEHVRVGDKTYDVYLRFKRNYKPYSMHLEDVHFDKYMGTDMAKNYSSDLRLVDPSRHVDRAVKIWMNNPLRFAGETFYQSSVDNDERGTGLQVVSNAGWMIPYVACMIVATGMLAQFLIVLLRFLRRVEEGRLPGRTPTGAALSAGVAATPAQKRHRSARAEPPRPPEPAAAPGLFTCWAPFALVALCAAWLFVHGAQSSQSGARKGQMDLAAFGRLPVVYQGRAKPYDTLARNTLRILSKRDTFVDENGDKQPAVRWLLDVISESPQAVKHKVFRIENLELLGTLGLQRRQGYRYAIDEFRQRLGEFDEQVQMAHKVPAAQLSTYQRKVLELNNHLRFYAELVLAFRMPPIGRDEPAKDLLAAIQQQQAMFSQVQPPLAVPPETAGQPWQPFAAAWTRSWAKAHVLGEKPDAATVELTDILDAYLRRKTKDFNDHTAKLSALLRAHPPANVDLAKVDFEAFYNAFDAFFLCILLYATAFILNALGWLGWPRLFHRGSFWLMIVALAVHAFGLAARIYISGRPPVTNLYSSAVFIGLGAVVLGSVLELIFKLGIGNLIASVGGFSTLLIAHYLAGDGDTFTVLQAVLDTQFWLATHVTCVTFGYAATHVAGLLGMFYIVAGFFSPLLARGVGKILPRMIYGVLCFAIFFSFVGTVLGGLWADDSWGRFWGWDPKENGALIIVLWNALVLHARWDGMVKDRGLAVLAVAGNIAVSWSWFGVNELGAGLHSYGFTEGVALALAMFVFSQLAVIAVGSLPKSLWRSFHGPQAA